MERINIVSIGTDLGDIRIHPDDLPKMMAVLAKLGRLAGTVGALQNIAGEIFDAHKKGNENAAEAFYEVLLTIEVKE